MITRAILIACAISLAASAAGPDAAAGGKAAADALPLPGAAPALPPLDAAPAKAARKEKKKVAPAPAALALPGADLALPSGKPAPAALPSGKPAPAALPLPGAPAGKSASAEASKPAPAKAEPARSDDQKSAAKAAPIPNATPAAGTAVLTRTVVAQQAAPAAPPAAAAPRALTSAAVPAGDLSLRPGESSLWSLRALVGAERSTEQGYTDAVSTSHLAVEGTRAFAGLWLARAQLDFRSSRQAYVLDHVGTAGQKGVFVDENRLDFVAGVGYDVGARLLQSGRLELTPMLGVQYLAIRNDAFPQTLIGPNLAGRARYALSSSVILQATVGYTYNLSVQSSADEHSALKAPVGDFAMRGGLALPLAGGYALELNYSGDILGFQNTYRVAHGAALGFGTSF